VSQPEFPHPDARPRRFTVRRAVALGGALLVVSVTVFATGTAYLWPLYIFPLFLAAVFFFELGSLLVSLWLGAFFALYYSVHSAPSSADLRRALLGVALSALAGLLLGRVQRNHHRLQALLAASSLSDRLTGLYNYGTFVDYLHNEVTKTERYGGELTMIMFDIDHFKEFNDRHGHEVGNELLRRVGATLRVMVREADMAARYGGEEFALLIRGDESHGYELAERVRRAIEALTVQVRGGAEVFATVSAGVASYPTAARDETELIERSDAALYESKRRGRNRVSVYSGSRESGLETSISA